MSSSPLKNKLNGFTLIEILLAIILVLIIMILLFDTFSGIRKSDIQIEQHRQKEKNIYFFSNYMSLLIKNMSSVQVFYNIKKTYFFLGEKNKMVFLSKRPLYYPLYVLHFVCVEFKNAQLNYKEKIFNSGEKLNSFDIFDEPSIVLLKDIKNFEIQYYVWDSLVNRHEWKREINSFSGDQLP
jgi:hypothetical protein